MAQPLVYRPAAGADQAAFVVDGDDELDGLLGGLHRARLLVGVGAGGAAASSGADGMMDAYGLLTTAREHAITAQLATEADQLATAFAALVAKGAEPATVSSISALVAAASALVARAGAVAAWGIHAERLQNAFEAACESLARSLAVAVSSAGPVGAGDVLPAAAAVIALCHRRVTARGTALIAAVPLAATLDSCGRARAAAALPVLARASSSGATPASLPAACLHEWSTISASLSGAAADIVYGAYLDAARSGLGSTAGAGVATRLVPLTLVGDPPSDKDGNSVNVLCMLSPPPHHGGVGAEAACWAMHAAMARERLQLPPDDAPVGSLSPTATAVVAALDAGGPPAVRAGLAFANWAAHQSHLYPTGRTLLSLVVLHADLGSVGHAAERAAKSAAGCLVGGGPHTVDDAAGVQWTVHPVMMTSVPSPSSAPLNATVSALLLAHALVGDACGAHISSAAADLVSAADDGVGGGGTRDTPGDGTPAGHALAAQLLRPLAAAARRLAPACGATTLPLAATAAANALLAARLDPTTPRLGPRGAARLRADGARFAAELSGLWPALGLDTTIASLPVWTRIAAVCALLEAPSEDVRPGASAGALWAHLPDAHLWMRRR